MISNTKKKMEAKQKRQSIFSEGIVTAFSPKKEKVKKKRLLGNFNLQSRLVTTIKTQLDDEAIKICKKSLKKKLFSSSFDRKTPIKKSLSSIVEILPRTEKKRRRLPMRIVSTASLTSVKNLKFSTIQSEKSD